MELELLSKEEMLEELKELWTIRQEISLLELRIIKIKDSIDTKTFRINQVLHS